MIKKLFFHIPSSAPWRRGVTRLGEFPSTGRLFSLVRFWKLQSLPTFTGNVFSSVKKVMLLFLAKTCWATFWANYSQTHLVTLIASASGTKDLSSNPAMALGFEGKHR
jgi:hypothetical protein